MAPHSQSAPVSNLARRLQTGRFAFTAEITPPVSCKAGDLLEKASPLKDLADAVNVTDGANARAHMSALAAAALLVQVGIEPVLQLVCRDRNRIALQADLLGAAALGIRNLLILTGDDPKAGDQPDATPVFDLDSLALTQLARDMRENGTLMNGRQIAGRPDFLIGAADMPFDPPPDWRPDRLAAKVDAGSGFVQTQFCMDAGIARRYMARLGEFEATRKARTLIGIAPLRSAKSARWMRDNLYGTIIPDAMIARMENAGDDAIAEGERICVELICDLATIPGIAGVHVMAPGGNDQAVPKVLAEARKQLGDAKVAPY